MPSGTCSPVALQAAIAVAVPSGSYRAMCAAATPSSRPTSRATAAKSAAGGTPRATSVATRRRAACSSASRVYSSRVAVFEKAAPISAENSARRSSMPGGGGASQRHVAITPQTSPSTSSGAPAAEVIPCARAASAIAPGMSA